MTELKPCPFCGGDAKKHMMVTGVMGIICDLCGLVSSFRQHEREKDAIVAWNRRHKEGETE